MRSLLITGGAGFIGGNFVHHWVRTHPEDRVVVLDALTYAGNRATLGPLEASGRIAFVHGDVRDGPLVDTVLADHDIDTLVHFAAESHVDRSILGPEAFVHTNVLGTQVLLDASRRAWCKDGEWRPGVRFHQISTDEVYGSLGQADPPFTERTPYAPNSPYAASKAAADHLVRASVHTHGLPASITNCSNNYGPYQFPEKLIPLVIVNILEGQSLPIYGDGLQIRDWLYVEDHCVAIEGVLCADAVGSTYNVGGRAERTNLEIVMSLCSLLDARFEADPTLAERFPRCPSGRPGMKAAGLIQHVRDRPGHDRRYAMDGTRIAAALGFSPSETLDSGLAKTADWYLSHEEWWRAVMDGSYRHWIARQYGSRDA